MSESNIHKVSMTDLVSHFEKIRTQQGEEAYQKARKDFALAMVLKPRGDQFVQQAFPEMDIEALKAEAAQHRPQVQNVQNPQDPQEQMLNAMRQQIPNLKTQAQFNLFMSAFDALRHTLNAAFGLDRPSYNKGKEVLDKTLDTALKISEVVEKLQQNPEAATSLASEEFKSPPREFQEYDVQRSLLAEVSLMKSPEELASWYESNRARTDCIVSQSLRNELFDAIRNKRKELSDG